MTELLNNLELAGRRRDRLPQDPRRHLPRHRRRAGAVGVVLAAGRRQLRGHRRQRQGRQLNSVIVPANAVLISAASTSLRLERASRGCAGSIIRLSRDASAVIALAGRREEPTSSHPRSPSPAAPDRLRAAARRRAPPRCRLPAMPSRDFDLAGRHQPDLDPPGLDPRAPHHLHHGAGRAVEDRGQRHRDAAALPGLDQRPAGRIHQQPAVVVTPTNTWPSWLLGSRWSTAAAPGRRPRRRR